MGQTRQSLALVFFCALTICGAAEAGPTSISLAAQLNKTAEAYWADTKLSTDQLHVTFRVKSCYAQGVKTFKACVFGSVASVVINHENALRVVPTSLLDELSIPEQQVVATYGPFTVTLVAPNPAQSAAEQARQKNREQRRIDEVIENTIYPQQLALKSGMNKCLAKATNEVLEQSCLASAPEDFIRFDLIAQDVYDLLISDPTLEASAVAHAMIAYARALDAHADFFPTDYFEKVLNNPTRKRFGVGIAYENVDGHVKVTRVYAGLPAALAGLQEGDEILEVDGVSTSHDGADKVAHTLETSSSPEAHFMVRRGTVFLSYEVERKPFALPNVEPRIVNHLGHPYGLIALSSFMGATHIDPADPLSPIIPSTCDEVTRAIQKLEAEKVEGLILDLRNNGGGLVDNALCVGSKFIGNSVLVQEAPIDNKTHLPDESKMQSLASPGKAITKLPLTVLIDRKSASASELLAGGLQDNRAAWIVGERSWGKGSVQTIAVARENYWGVITGAILERRTTSLFYQPSGRTNQLAGIFADFEAFASPDIHQDPDGLREADLFPNAIRPANPIPWREPADRALQIAVIKACMDADPSAIQAFRSGAEHDYQLLVAEQVQKCSVVPLKKYSKFGPSADPQKKVDQSVQHIGG